MLAYRLVLILSSKIFSKEPAAGVKFPFRLANTYKVEHIRPQATNKLMLHVIAIIVVMDFR